MNEMKLNPLYWGVQHTHAWAKGRPIAFAMAAQQAAAGAMVVPEYVEVIRQGRVAAAAYEQGAVLDYLHLYRDPGRVRQVVRRIMLNPELGGAVAQLLESIQRRKRSGALQNAKKWKDLPDQAKALGWMFFGPIQPKMYVEHLQELRGLIHDVDGRPELNFDMEILKPEMQFMVLVFLPCIFEYGRSPLRLYASARRGDLQAIDYLYRIDKTLQGDPVVGKLINRYGMTRSENQTEILAEAYRGHPEVKQEIGLVKARFAAHLQLLADRLGYSVKPKELRGLFDALVKDRTGDPYAIDVDLPDAGEAWRQAVKRARSGYRNTKPFWQMDIVRDTIAQDECHAELVLESVVCDFDDSQETPGWLEASLLNKS